MVATLEHEPRAGRWLVWLPIPVFAVAIVLAWADGPQAAHESWVTLTVLNLLFLTTAALFVAYLCARSFVVMAEPGLLLLGGGVLTWGLASGVASVTIFHEVNFNVTVYNLGVVGLGGGSLAGAVLSRWPWVTVRTPGPWLVAIYAASIIAVALMSIATLEGWLPVFFIQGVGGTPVRQFVVASAAVMLGLATAVLGTLGRRAPSRFVDWYAPGIGVVALGLGGVLLDTLTGSLLDWICRAAQYMGGLYLLVAGIAAVRDARGWQLSLSEALRASQRRYAAFAAATVEGIIESNDGRIVSCNEQFARMVGCPLADLVGRTIAEFVAPDDLERVRSNITSNVPSVVEHRMVRTDGTQLVVEAHGQPAALGTPNRFTTIRDITEQKRALERVERLTRLYAVLSRVNEAIVRIHDEQDLYSEICRIVADTGRFRAVWIAVVDKGHVVARAIAGPASAYPSEIQIETRGRLSEGAAGVAIREGRSVVVTDLLTNPATAPWADAARRNGICAHAAFPLRRLGETIGVIMLGSSSPEIFDTEEVRLLASLAANVSYALDAMHQQHLHLDAVEQLRQSEERFRVVAASTPDHLMVQDQDLRYRLVVNPQLGFTEAQMLGKTDAEILGGKDADALTALKRRVLATGESLHVTLPVMSLKGTQEFFEGSYVARRDASGATDGVIGYFRNVTERLKAEDGLRRSEEERLVNEAVHLERQRLYDMLETLPAMICLLTPDHQVPFANKGFRTEFGDANGRRCYEYCFGRSAPCEFCESFTVLETGRPHRWEVTTSNGTILSIADVPFTDASGTPMIVEMSLDITAARQAELALRDAHERLATRAEQLRGLAGELALSEQKERRRLASFLHDHLQQLLVAAKWRAATLVQSCHDGSATSASEIEGLLTSAIAEVSSLTTELSPPVIRAGGLPADLAWLARWSHDKHGVEVDLDIDDHLPALAEDVRVLLFGAVRELLFNAAKHAHVRTVSVTASRTDAPGVRVTVADKGVGFDVSELARPSATGRGFGLFSIQERLDLVGGSLDIRSARGQGSRFTVTIEDAASAALTRGVLADEQAVDREDLGRLVQ
jgi:PAS domain S-box-containing protein